MSMLASFLLQDEALMLKHDIFAMFFKPDNWWGYCQHWFVWMMQLCPYSLYMLCLHSAKSLFGWVSLEEPFHQLVAQKDFLHLLTPNKSTDLCVDMTRNKYLKRGSRCWRDSLVSVAGIIFIFFSTVWRVNSTWMLDVLVDKFFLSLLARILSSNLVAEEISSYHFFPSVINEDGTFTGVVA